MSPAADAPLIPPPSWGWVVILCVLVALLVKATS
jgi:hypothetical protein